MKINSTRKLDFSKPLIMGVLNVTPDSFSDGGRSFNIDDAVQNAQEMIESGANIIDVGGESTRPGATPVSVEEEISRVIPVIEKLQPCSVPISIDTYKAEVAGQALNAGADIINDVMGLVSEEMISVAAKHKCPVIIMHMQNSPSNMQDNPVYDNVIEDVKSFFEQRIDKVKKAGVDKIILDPGIGFGKTLQHNLEILGSIREFKELGYPILIGTSRKSFIEKVTGASVENRLPGSLASALKAVSCGADIVRVHDIAETKQALDIWQAIS